MKNVLRVQLLGANGRVLLDRPFADLPPAVREYLRHALEVEAFADWAGPLRRDNDRDAPS